MNGPRLPYPPRDPAFDPMPRRPSYESDEAPTERTPNRDVTDLPQFSLPPPGMPNQQPSHGTSPTVLTPTTVSLNMQLYGMKLARPTEHPSSNTIRPVYVTSTGPSLKETSSESAGDSDEYDEVTQQSAATTAAETLSTLQSKYNIPPPARPFPQFPKDYVNDEADTETEDWAAQPGGAAQGVYASHSSASPVFFSYATNPSRPTVLAEQSTDTVRPEPSPSVKFSAIRPHPAIGSADPPSYRPPRPHYPYPIPRFGPGTMNPDIFQERVDLVASETEPDTKPPTTTSASSEPQMVSKVPIQAPVSLSSGRFPSGPRSLKSKRNAAGPSDQLGVRGSLKVIAGVDLAFLPNVTRDNAMVYTGRYEEIIYGVCLPATGLAASIGVFVLLIICTSCIAAYLYYVLRTYKAKSKQSFVLRHFLSTYRNRKVKH